MRTMSRTVAFAAALGCATLACGIGARAQDYPSHPITMIVPFPAGGPTDTLGRILGEGMRASLGQPIVVENVTGAGSTIGVTRAAQAAPDGYTLSLGNWTSFVGSGALYRTSYDLLRDFEPVSLLTFAPMLIVGKNALPVKDARELIAWLKANRTRPRPPASVPAARRTCAGFISKTRPTPGSNSCPIAAGRLRCRTWLAGRSISCAPRPRKR